MTAQLTCSNCDHPIAADAPLVRDTETPERVWCSEDCQEAEQEKAAEFNAR